MNANNAVGRGDLHRSLIVALLLSTSGISLPVLAQTTTETAGTMVASKTEDVASAADAFLKTLDDETLAKVQFAFPGDAVPGEASFARSTTSRGTAAPTDENAAPAGAGGGGGFNMAFVGEQYGDAVWSNYPVSDVPRPGVQLGALTEAQRLAAMTLLQTVLSPDGYQKVLDIMGSDQALADEGQNFASGEDVYTLAILGTPSATEPWMIEFGGHHLGLNIVIYGADGVMTPTLTGTQPAVYTNKDGQTVRVLADENDTAFALLDALTDDQRSKAILDYEVSDLVSGPGKYGEVIVPEGLMASEMTTEQQALLLDVVVQWVGVLDPAYAEPRMDEIKAGLADTYFAWSGPTTHEADRNGSSYYRIQGPKLIIEFSPQAVGGDLTMHVHTIYRDPTNDYGLALTTK